MEKDGASGRVTHGSGFGQNLLHPLVGRKRLAFLDADRLEVAEPDLIEGIGRLLLHDLVEQFPER